MARVLLAWELGENFGHLASLGPIAAELTRRGHQVFAALRDVANAGRFFGNRIPLLQAPEPRRKRVGPPTPLRERTYTDILDCGGYDNPLQLAMLIRAWRSLLELARPDLTIYESAPTAMLASRTLPLVKVAFGSGYSLPPLTSPLPAFLPDLDLPAPELEMREQARIAVINAALDSQRLPRIGAMRDIFEADAILIKSVPELDQYGARRGVDYVGPAYNLDAGEDVEWPTGRGPRVFVYLRPPAERIPALTRYFAGSPLRVIAVVPSASAETLNQLSLPNVCATVHPARLRPLVRTAHAAICHSAVGTGAAFLFSGVPLLLIPTNVEQKMSALRVVEYGAALAAFQGPPTFPALLTRLLREPGFRRNARRLAAKYAADPDDRTQRLCNRIERALSEHADKPR